MFGSLAAKLEKDLTKLFRTFYLGALKGTVAVKCFDFYDAYNPSTDEVATYKYKVRITIGTKAYMYDG